MNMDVFVYVYVFTYNSIEIIKISKYYEEILKKQLSTNIKYYL